jgi:hypothetical protein
MTACALDAARLPAGWLPYLTDPPPWLPPSVSGVIGFALVYGGKDAVVRRLPSCLPLLRSAATRIVNPRDPWMGP